MRPRIGIPCDTMEAKDANGVRRMDVPEPYVERVEEAGGMPILFPVVDPARAPEYLDLVHGLLLIGGDDVDPALYGEAPHPRLGPVDRRRDDMELACARAAVERGMPVLGICRGLQLLNVAFGGSLHQHVPDAVGSAVAHGGSYGLAHDVSVSGGSRLSAIAGAATIDVNSHHHQALDRCAGRLVVTARARDGVVEAAEDPKVPFLVGVQWHPERMPKSPATARLFAAFVQAAAGRARASAG
jgi:putative glutamine amidotransferase